MRTEDFSTGGPLLAVTLQATQGAFPLDRLSGTRLGKYQIQRQLGSGGMGIVHEAVDPVLQRSVAIKVLREDIASQPEAVRRFLLEARTAARLNHPNVVHVYEADQEKGIVYLVMELMRGGSAHDWIREHGHFSWSEASQIVLEACQGLAAVHAVGLIHRDIKPSNIMRSLDNVVKLADFGLALSTSMVGTTASGQVVGTPLYMSPEQCQGEPVDARSDLYSLGATYFALLTGQAPFSDAQPLQVMFAHCSKPVPDPRTLREDLPAA